MNVRSGISKAKVIGEVLEDSNPYFVKGTINMLLEVGRSMALQSPQKEKKPAKIGEDEVATIPVGDAPSKMSRKDEKLSRREANLEETKLVTFNVYETLLDSNLLLDKNPNSVIQPTLRTEKCQIIFLAQPHSFSHNMLLTLQSSFLR